MSKALFEAVAKQLGAKFVERSDNDRGVFVMPNGVEFFAITGGYSYKGKIHFSSHFPQHVRNEQGEMTYTAQSAFMPYGTPHFDGINVSDKKTAEQIAKDIKRRFLPEYEPIYAKAVEYCEQQKTYWDKRTNLSDLAKKSLAPFGYGSKKSFHAAADYIGSENVRVSIDNLDADRLQKLAAFLHTL